MFPVGLEFIVHERRKKLLREAERMRLINALQRQQSKERKYFWIVVNWLGTQMVKWGLKLQSYKMGPPTQVGIMGVADAECRQC
jgi:hypothetical protein